MTVSPLEALVGSLGPVGLDELNRTSALTRRIDNKYIVGFETLTEVVAALHQHGHQVLDIEGRRTFRYRSIYYDSPDLHTYRSHIQRRRRRFKCRRRDYLDSGRVVAEVKLKGPRGLTVKRGIPVESGSPGPHEDFFRAVVEEQYGDWIGTPLQKTLTTDYLRFTLRSPDRTARITCDSDLTLTAADGSRFQLAPDRAIVETKSRLGTSDADRVLIAAGARPVAISKYVVGIGLAHPATKTNDFRAVLRRHFTPLQPGPCPATP